MENINVENRKVILDTLLDKSALKQDIIQDTKRVFHDLRKVIDEEVGYFKSSLTDERIRMQYVNKGDYETHVYVGSDVLLFHMHTNVFLLPRNHPYWEKQYLKEHPENGYFGIVYIYNFLAESLIQGRYNDPGYLIGRIFINREGRFFVEGKGALGEQFTDIEEGTMCDEILRNILHTSFSYALDFDLLTPPYEIVSQISVQQVQAISNSLNMQTGKRLGFKFEAEEAENF